MRQHTILRRIKHLRTVSQCRQLTCENVNKKQLKSQYDAVVIGSGNSLRKHAHAICTEIFIKLQKLKIFNR